MRGSTMLTPNSTTSAAETVRPAPELGSCPRNTSSGLQTQSRHRTFKHVYNGYQIKSKRESSKLRSVDL